MKKLKKVKKKVTAATPFFSGVAADVYHFADDTRQAIVEKNWESPTRFLDEEVCSENRFGCQAVWVDSENDSGIVLVAPGHVDLVALLRRAANDIERLKNVE